MSNRRVKHVKKGKRKTDAEVVSIVHRAMRAQREIKYLDTTFAATNVSTTTLFYNLSIVPQGAAQGQRVGDEMWLDKIEVKMNVTTANADIFSIVRLFMFYWRIPTATANPVVGNIFNSIGTQGVFTPLSYEYRSMYQVVGKDWMLNNTGTAAAPTVNSQFIVDDVLGLGGKHVQFTAGATTGNNLLFLTLVSNSAIAPFPVFQGTWRLWYYDERA